MQLYLLSCPTCTCFTHKVLSEIIRSCLFYYCHRYLRTGSTGSIVVWNYLHLTIFMMYKHIYIYIVTRNFHWAKVFFQYHIVPYRHRLEDRRKGGRDYSDRDRKKSLGEKTSWNLCFLLKESYIIHRALLFIWRNEHS